jgi:sarcosine oxidase, subunit gamma
MSEAIQTPLHYYLGQTSGQTDDQSPSQANPGVLVRESASHGFLALRGGADSELFRTGVKRVLGIELPVEPCTFNNRNEAALFWLGPSEWLALVMGGTEESTEAELRQVLRGHCSIADVSGGLTLFNLGGKDADEILQKSCTYGFHPRNFQAGRCVQTPFAKTTALVSRACDGSFDVVIRRSFADYLAKWILDAGRESGCRIERLQPSDAW